MRRRHLTGNENINCLCLEWFKDAVNRRLNVTGPLLKEKENLNCGNERVC